MWPAGACEEPAGEDERQGCGGRDGPETGSGASFSCGCERPRPTERLDELRGRREPIRRRSASTVVSARSTGAGTVSRTVRTDGTGFVIRLAMIACAVGPVYGGSPASISYSTQPSA